MTKLLDQAIEHVRELIDEEQDATARVLLAYISSDERSYALMPEQVAGPRCRELYFRTISGNN